MISEYSMRSVPTCWLSTPTQENSYKVLEMAARWISTQDLRWKESKIYLSLLLHLLRFIKTLLLQEREFPKQWTRPRLTFALTIQERANSFGNFIRSLIQANLVMKHGKIPMHIKWLEEPTTG